MRSSVFAAFPGFITRFEGRLPFMYLDTKGLVTTGVGNLLDPMAPALSLPWLHKNDGQPATRAEVVDDWNRVKGAQALRNLGGGHFAQLTKLYLADDAIDSLVRARLSLNEAVLRSAGGFGGWDTYPAAAQLGILDMAWNMGPAFKFPKFRAAAAALDWATCADECKIDGAPPERNACHDRLFRFAAAGGDPDALP